MKKILVIGATFAFAAGPAWAGQGLTSIVDIKNRDQQMARVDTDAVTSVFIGGGRSDAARIVGQEFADITRGTRIHNRELAPLLAAILTEGGRRAPGLEGVSLVSLSSTGFTIAISGSAGSTNFIEFTGSAAEAAIADTLFLVQGKPGLDLKNAASQVALFDTDVYTSIFSGSASQTSVPVKSILGGSRLNIAEAGELFSTKVRGRGLGGVTVIGLTDKGVTLRIEASGASVDTIIFEGADALAEIEAVDNGFADTKDSDSEFVIFDVATESNQFKGGDGSDTPEFRSIVKGSFIQPTEVLQIFSAIIHGNGRNGNSHGLDGVELIGLNATSFAIAVTNTRGATDYILFTNVDTLTGSDELGFGANDESAETPL